MSGSESEMSPRSEDETTNYSPESFFPGDNEIFDDTTAWGSPEYNFWSYFFKIVSHSGEDYHTPFSSRVNESPTGKIDWDFWLKESINGGTGGGGGGKNGDKLADPYETALQLLIRRVAIGEFVFGRDYAKKLRDLVDAVKVHREAHLALNPPAFYSSHRSVLDYWLQFEGVLKKIKTGPSISDWIVMVVIAAMGVYMYYLYASITAQQ